MCTISEDKTCYSYVRTKFNFSRDHNVLTPLVALPVTLLKTMIQSGLYRTTPTYSVCQKLSRPHVNLQCKQNKVTLSNLLIR